MMEVENAFSTARLTNSDVPNVLNYLDSLEQKIHLAAASGINNYTLFISAITPGASIPKKLRDLKLELGQIIPSPASILNCKYTRNGKLLISTDSSDTAISLANLKTLFGIAVVPSLQIETITSRFLLTDIPVDIPLEELAAEVEANNLFVQELRRFREKGGPNPSESVLVSVFGHHLPTEVKLFYTVQKIRLFIDSVRQCTKCFKFNHQTKKCPSEVHLCSKCGSNHLSTNCDKNPPICVNCSGHHLATDFLCPRRQEEKHFLHFKCNRHLSFSEARRLFKGPTKSYSSVTSPSATTLSPNLESIVATAVATAVKSIENTLANFIEVQERVNRQHSETLTQLFDLITRIVGNRDSSAGGNKRKLDVSDTASSHAPDLERSLPSTSTTESDNVVTSIAERVKTNTTSRPPTRTSGNKKNKGTGRQPSSSA